jgi:uncharacterized membrane protein YgaE (UPF0421/DUF939 family)
VVERTRWAERGEREARERDGSVTGGGPAPSLGDRAAHGQRLAHILQTSVAASLSYLLAAFALGSEEPFFAPIAAVATPGLAPVEHGVRAVEVALGVAVGLAVADVIVWIIGVGAAQIGVVGLAMAVAVFFGERTLLVNQAAISAILVVIHRLSTRLGE